MRRTFLPRRPLPCRVTTRRTCTLRNHGSQLEERATRALALLTTISRSRAPAGIARALRSYATLPAQAQSSPSPPPAPPPPPPPATASEPTIYALSTAPGRAAIAVIRISGSQCLPIYRALCPDARSLKPRTAAVRSLYAPDKPPSPRTLLDSSALVLYFPAPKTATGEDLLELHVHGGTAVVKAVLAAIPRCRCSSGTSSKSTEIYNTTIRYAEPGEFTRRAFTNGRLDLTQVEALGDVLSASTEQQRRLSVIGSTSKLADRYDAWRQHLLAARGELEALIDFSEDQHFDESPAQLCASVAAQVTTLKARLEAHARNAVRGELLRSGISIALLGPPNAGKSTLLNSVVGREAAIVSREAGTTRDVVEVAIDLGGFLCRLGDTAGLRGEARASTATGIPQGVEGQEEFLRHYIGSVEQEGMRRAKQRAEESDVVIVVLSLELNEHGETVLPLDREVVTTASRLAAEKSNVLVVLNKTDLLPASSSGASSRLSLSDAIYRVQKALPAVPPEHIFPISCHHDARGTTSASASPNGGSVHAFLSALTAKFEQMTRAVTPDGEPDPSLYQESLGATERHRLLLDEAITYLGQFLSQVSASSDPVDGVEDEDIDIVLAAESLRAAATCLARITGRSADVGDVEEVLGVVFERFCVGK